MTSKQLKSIMLLCRKHGVLKLKLEGLELELTENYQSEVFLTKKQASEASSTTKQSEPPNPADMSWDQMSDEQRLFWSTNTPPELEGS